MKTNEDLISDLFAHAKDGSPGQFQYLKSYREYNNAKVAKRTYALVIAALRQSLNKQFKTYCKSITVGETDVIKLLAYCTTKKVLDFYEEEFNTIKDMIIEYECYLVNGNLCDFILGITRPDEKLWDHRSL